MLKSGSSDVNSASPISISRQVRADRGIEAGEVVFVLPGVYTAERDAYSIQVRPNLHQAFTDDIDDYVNHSCDPNLELIIEGNGAAPDNVYFRALRDVRKGEEVTWDYLTTETEISVPFECGCGAVNCRGRIG